VGAQLLYEGLRVISVADKANPTEAGSFDTPGDARGVHVAMNSEVGTAYVYVADRDGGLVILRISGLPSTAYLPLVLKSFGP